ncbi:hypothetical protein [Aliarcobacter butzleri]|uniref:hypothetical protein n=1 Tax=Aliarcobacter butzleri TaxID=28197 RepID=UPI001269FD10|nr:hypothetical protein [Aliarcobacter butzleri]
MKMQFLDEIPELITLETVKQIQALSDIVNLSKEHSILYSKLMQKYNISNTLYLENNIDKTLDNINNDLMKSSFTGKELKNIISTHKFNQYNITLVKLFEDMASLCYEIQSKKEDIRLIDPVDIFTILYITKHIEDISENTLLEDGKKFFYEEAKFLSIFDLDTQISNNPFFKFLDSIPDLDCKTEPLVDTQKIDELFYVD